MPRGSLVKLLGLPGLLVLLGLTAIVSFAPAMAGGTFSSKGNMNNEYALQYYLFNLYNQQKQDQFNQLPKAEPPRYVPPPT